MFGITANLFGWIAVITLATLVVSGIALPWLLTRLPEDYFLEIDRPVRPTWPQQRIVLGVPSAEESAGSRAVAGGNRDAGHSRPGDSDDLGRALADRPARETPL